MKCPYCGYSESKVIDSRPAEEGSSIRRRRECLSCKKRFTTYETVESLPMVVVKKDGKPWATAKRVTTGDSAAVKADVDRSTIAGDGHDLSFVELALTDAEGNIVPTDSRRVSFSIEGPAELVGFCNGDPTDWTCMQDLNQRFFNGRLLAVVRGKRGESGTATVTVKANELPTITVPITVEAAK